ncbi:MAG: aminotransferase class V-fold PLP-dependent enzyme, partial [Clostridia bacterium]|nr:aminotransferase class V-fold PLP-dependent enzyme [Clostridia bacterium]
MIYLDNAATTFPKPPAVVQAVCRHIEKYGGNPGRGAHQLSLQAAEVVYQCREALSALLGLDAPEGIVFTQNTTYALNMLLKG